MKKILLLLLLSFVSFSTVAAEQKNYSLFVGFGELYSRTSYRVGIHSWEFGLLNKSALGITKNFYSDNKYISFGPAVVYSSAKSSLGFFGAVGIDFTFFNWLYIKAELNAARSVSNYGFGSAMLGLGVYW